MKRNILFDSPINGARNFTLWELIRSDYALRHNINNIPPGEHIKNLNLLATKILQPIRDKFGPIRITSGYRCVELCEAIGSTAQSNHARGQAADIEPINPNIKLLDILEFVHNELMFRELIAEYFPSGWVHVAYRKNKNIRKLKLKDDNHNYQFVSLEYIKNIYGDE